MEHTVYENPRSPYLPLLRDAGITYENATKTVQQKGLEGTLKDFRDVGVYLTFEEYKGRQPLIRHGKIYPFNSEGLKNTLLLESIFHTRTGGSTGPSVDVPFNPRFHREQAANIGTLFAMWMPAVGAKGALWYPLQPGLSSLIFRIVIGQPPAAWFTPSVESLGQSWRLRLLVQTIKHLAHQCAISVPSPQHVPLNEAHRIAQWIVEQKQTSPACMIITTVSNAVHICEAAQRHKLDIRGTRFFIDSEPLTEAKRDEITATGCTPLPDYYADDAGSLALPCGNPASADDMHVCTHMAAIITRCRFRPGSEDSVESFLITTLLPTSPQFLLNVEFDDFGVLGERDCGCRLGELGLKLHVSQVRSFSKLTTQGTTVPLGDVAWVIEQVLPRRFGGASIHYQLLEEDLGSQTRLTLVVSPQVGPFDEREVLRVFLTELRTADIRLVQPTQLWEESGALRVVRAEPLVTPRGKLLPVRILRDYERSRLPP